MRFVAKPEVVGSSCMAYLPGVVQTALLAYLADKHNYADVTVTSLERTPKQFALNELAGKLWDPAAKMGDSLLMLQGTSLHQWFEPNTTAAAAKQEAAAGKACWLIEHPLLIDFLLDPGRPAGPGNSYKLGGTLDLFDIEAAVLWDYKLINNFKLGHAAKDYRAQMNAYRVMLKHLGFPEPVRMNLIEFSRDFSDPAKGGKSQNAYPIKVEEVPRDDTISVNSLIALARERVATKNQFRDMWAEAKPSRAKAVARARELAAKLPPCPREYTHEWGMIKAGAPPRKCHYCPARNICDQFNGGAPCPANCGALANGCS